MVLEKNSRFNQREFSGSVIRFSEARTDFSSRITRPLNFVAKNKLV
jgi:hypothetical protein